jgi:hypothetical protein
MSKIFVESYIAKVYIHVVFCHRRTAAAAAQKPAADGEPLAPP